jgi:transcriptional regulatory protein LevR
MDLILRHKKKLTGLILIVCFSVIIKFSFFNKTEFIVLEQMTKIDSTENSIQEYILVKNPPKHSYELKNLILEFNSKRDVKFSNIHQLFLKEHDYIYLPKIVLAFTLSENYSYLDKKTNTDQLDNIDFLAERNKYNMENKKAYDTTYVWVYKYCYYKQ